MSHYTVAVFTKTAEPSELEALLAPFDEAITVPPYIRHTKEELIAQEREQFQHVHENQYALWKKNPAKYEADCKNPEHIAFLRRLPQLMTQTDEKIYQHAISFYDEEEISPCGGVFSTYNPHSKWDWYAVGGRWHGMLILKDNCTGKRGSPGLMTEPSANFDSAKTVDVDFAAMSRKKMENLAPYEDAMREGIYREEFNRKCYPTEEEYIQRNSAFTTYAVLTPDGVWHAPGDMGWWGMSSEGPDEKRKWDLDYYERFIKPAIESGWYITIVDCHI